MDAEGTNAAKSIQNVLYAYSNVSEWPSGSAYHEQSLLRSHAERILTEIEEAAHSAIRDLPQLPIPPDPRA